MPKILKVLTILTVLTVLPACTFLGYEFSVTPAEETPEETTEEPTTPTTPDEPETPTTSATNYFESGDIDYHKEPKTLSIDNFAFPSMHQFIIEAYYGAGEELTPEQQAERWASIKEGLSLTDVGTIKKAPYKDWNLIVFQAMCDGMCMKQGFFRIAWNPKTNKTAFLTQHSDAESESMDFIFKIFPQRNYELTLSGLDLPGRIAIPNSDQFLQRSLKDARMFEEIENLTVVFTDPSLGKVYSSSVDDSFGCFYVKAADGTVSRYEYNPGFFDNGGDIIKWDNGKATQIVNNYTYQPGGCGIDGNCYMLEKIKKENLTPVGKSGAGITFYTVKTPIENASTETDKSVSRAQEMLATAYTTHKEMHDYQEELKGKTPPTFKEFTAKNPVLFWQDPLGRWSNLIAKEARPPVECGKPVIYLYPQEPTDVHVQVHIDEFTKTIPPHGPEGWTVHAQPNGTLHNYADGQEYPYLFWEGHKKEGISTDQGFVVPRAEISAFLATSLDQLGLNATESADFLEFWEPRILENPEPYTFFSFIGTQDFNKVAPLTIEPAPDTLLRIFMYYQPLDRPISVLPQTLRSQDRHGFTVVEWGGTSSRPWRK